VEGGIMMRIENSFTPAERKEIKRLHFEKHRTVARIAIHYGTRVSIIQRILGVS
jgi:hypothetical protein